MNIKRGLKRIWLAISVLWIVFWFAISFNNYESNPAALWVGLTIPVFLFWAMLYIGFWIASGFKNND